MLMRGYPLLIVTVAINGAAAVQFEPVAGSTTCTVRPSALTALLIGVTAITALEIPTLVPSGTGAASAEAKEMTVAVEVTVFGDSTVAVTAPVPRRKRQPAGRSTLPLPIVLAVMNAAPVGEETVITSSASVTVAGSGLYAVPGTAVPPIRRSTVIAALLGLALRSARMVTWPLTGVGACVAVAAVATVVNVAIDTTGGSLIVTSAVSGNAAVQFDPVAGSTTCTVRPSALTALLNGVTGTIALVTPTLVPEGHCAANWTVSGMTVALEVTVVVDSTVAETTPVPRRNVVPAGNTVLPPPTT